MRINRSPFGRTPTGYSIQASDHGVEILLYDEISFFGINAQGFVRDLKAVDAGKIVLRINSPGGNVFDGLAIYNALVTHPARIEVHIDGVAASMASIVALAGDEIHMASNAFFMIHEPWSIVLGPAEDLRREADLLDKMTGVMAETYVGKTGAEMGEVTAWMEAETWFTAAEAKDAGFIDHITKADKKSAAAQFDLSVFANAPDGLGAGNAVPSERELERRLRDAGLSRSEAKAHVAEVRKTIAQRDAGDDGIGGCDADKQALAARIRRLI